MNKRFGVIGGDRRQAELARLLRRDGHRVVTYGLQEWKPGGEATLDQAAGQEIVVLPLPLCRGEQVLNCRADPVTTRWLWSSQISCCWAESVWFWASAASAGSWPFVYGAWGRW